MRKRFDFTRNANENDGVDPDAPFIGLTKRRFRYDPKRGVPPGADRPRPEAGKRAKSSKRTVTRRPPKLAIVRALVAMGEAEAAANGGRFVIDNYRLMKVPGSENWYRSHYDDAVGWNRKVTLGTADLDEAKVALAAFVADDSPDCLDESTDLSVEVAVEFYITDPKRLKSWHGTAATLLRALEQAVPGVTIATFTRRLQKELILALRAGVSYCPLEVGSISNCMILAQAAINAACQPNDEGKRLCTAQVNPILTSNAQVAEFLNVAGPTPRNWHPTFEEMGAFLKFIENDVPLRQWSLLALGFACRPDAAATATSHQFDDRKGIFYLNPAGRRQEPSKYRPDQPLPPSLRAELACWPGGEWVGEDLEDLRRRFKAAGACLGLGEDFIPSCTRDFMATAMREAYVRYGIPFVPDQQVEMWMGHRHKGINHLYGQFGPEYLLLVRNAVECILHELDDLSGGVLFRHSKAAGTLPADPVVIDPYDLHRRGRAARRTAKSGKSEAVSAGEEGAITNGSPIMRSCEKGGKRWGRAILVGPLRGKPRRINVPAGTVKEITGKPERDKGIPAPEDLLERLEAQGYRLFEQSPPPGREGEKPEIFIAIRYLQLLSDQDAKMIFLDGNKWKHDARIRKMRQNSGK